MRHRSFFVALLSILSFGPISAKPVDLPALKQQVIDTERAFAQTMATRDFNAFSTFLSAEAVFFTRGKPLHGKQEVMNAWKGFYEKAEAPFSWEPESVEVLDSGTLALSTGPVRDSKGKLFSTFTSIWRLEESGKWRIVFDKGNPVCDKP